MNRDQCIHEWGIMREGGPRTDEGHGGEMYPAVCKCSLCSIIMSAAEAMQVSAVQNQTKSLENQTKLAKHQMGFQKWLSLSAVIISFISLVVAALVAINK